MFERFTDRARRVLVLAQEEARLLNHNYVGPEHILLGLVREGEGAAAQVLVSLGADLSRVRQQVIQVLAEYPSPGDTEQHLSPGSRATGFLYRINEQHGPARRWVTRHPGIVGLVLGCVSGGSVTAFAVAQRGGSRLRIRRGS